MSDNLYTRWFWTGKEFDGRTEIWCVAQIMLNGEIVAKAAVDLNGENKDPDLCRRSAISRVHTMFSQNYVKDIREVKTRAADGHESVPNPSTDDGALSAS